VPKTHTFPLLGAGLLWRVFAPRRLFPRASRACAFVSSSATTPARLVRRRGPVDGLSSGSVTFSPRRGGETSSISLAGDQSRILFFFPRTGAAPSRGGGIRSVSPHPDASFLRKVQSVTRHLSRPWVDLERSPFFPLSESTVCLRTMSWPPRGPTGQHKTQALSPTSRDCVLPLSDPYASDRRG